MNDKYEKAILSRLLDKYEGSKSFKGENKVNQKFSVKIESIFPKYVDHSNYEVFQNVNDGIDILARKNLITANVNKAKVCNEAVLNLSEIDEAYRYIGRERKKDVNDCVMQLLERYKGINETLSKFCDAQVERIRANKTVQFFNGDFKEFENVLTAVEELLKVELETFARDFSIRVFKDSKLFERISSKVVRLLFEYGDFPEREQVLADLNIVKNPTYVNFKGAGIIELSGQRIDLNKLNGDIGISSSLLHDIDRIKITGHSVMTVENLTSFHTVNVEGVFLIYLGGFHNSIRREFIKKIYAQNPYLKYLHFGDIDAGGFYILEHLKKRSEVDFLPYQMDIETLKEFNNYTKKLTDNDRKRLSKMEDGLFKDVIRYMLENDCKLEQEAINIKHRV